MNGSIYMIKSPSGKIYIGQTRVEPLKRWKNHVTNGYRKSNKGKHHLYDAFKAYKPKNMEFTVLISGVESQDKLNELETLFIKSLNTTDRSCGYNFTLGGQNTHSPESTEKMRATLKRRYASGEITVWNKGKNYTPWNKGKKGVQVAWNKGLKMKTKPSVKEGQ